MDQYYTEYNMDQNDFYDPFPMEPMGWAPNLFAKLVKYLQNSTSPDVIRMGMIAGIRNVVQTEEEKPTSWDKVENMRRYVDSVNRGLDFLTIPTCCTYSVHPNGQAMACSP